MYMKKILISVFSLLILFSSQAQTPGFIRDSLDAYIARGLKEWDLPGLAIVIVKDGKVVVMKGYGERDIQTHQPVNEHTQFMIASNTKLFTGVALANLAYEKKISLDDKITKYYPWYRLYDTLASGSVTIRDMLCHRLGTKTFQGDFTFWNSMLSREEIMRRMSLLKPIGLFRQDYGYCNSCFLTAGQVIPVVTGQSWESYVQEKLLNPLGMTRSTTISKGMESRENVSRPYTTSFSSSLQRVPYDQWDNLGPAASIVSTVSDLSHWLQFQLDSGRYQGQRILPFQVLQATRDVNIVTGSRRSSAFPIHFRGYGLGVFAADYNGRQVYWHTGGAAGMVSNVCFVPEENLGIAILTNNDNQSFFEALRYQVLDAYLDVPFVNRSQQFLTGALQGNKAQLDQIAQWRARVKGAKPELPLKAYTGEYVHPLYGKLLIRETGEGLYLELLSHADLKASLRYMDNGEWLMEYQNIEYGVFSIPFHLENNQVVSIEVRANEFVEYDPYIFRKL